MYLTFNFNVRRNKPKNDSCILLYFPVVTLTGVVSQL